MPQNQLNYSNQPTLSLCTSAHPGLPVKSAVEALAHTSPLSLSPDGLVPPHVALCDVLEPLLLGTVTNYCFNGNCLLICWPHRT